MILATGGFACGATSTRSRSSSWACRSASCVETMPIWAPSGPTRRTCADRIRSFIRGSAETPHHLPSEEKAPGASRCLQWNTANRCEKYRCGSVGCRGSEPPRVPNLDGPNVGGLLALGAVDDVELDRLTLGERAVSLALDRGEVNEHVVLSFTRDEAEALLVAEPLDGALLCQPMPPVACLASRAARARRRRGA